MDRSAFFRRAFSPVGRSEFLRGVLLAKEHPVKEARSSEPPPGVSVLHAETESLLRVDFPGLKSWRHVGKGARLEGRFPLPLYVGERIVAPADSKIRVTVKSIEKVREDLGFWRKTGRTIVRAFTPLETSRPTEYQLELSAADLLLATGEVLPLDACVLRASSGVMVEPKAKSLQTPGAVREKSKGSGKLLMALRQETMVPFPAQPVVAPVAASGEHRVARACLLTALRASQNHEGDTFRGQLAEPVAVAGRMFAPGTLVEGTVVCSGAPKKLSRAGRVYLSAYCLFPPVRRRLSVAGPLNARGNRVHKC